MKREIIKILILIISMIWMCHCFNIEKTNRQNMIEIIKY